MKAGREQSMSASQVLHYDGEAPHLSLRYHVYVTALLKAYSAYQRVIERDYCTT